MFFEKRLNLKTGFGIQNSITLIDEIYNEGKKMYPELARVLNSNIDQIIQIFKTIKLEKYTNKDSLEIKTNSHGGEKIVCKGEKITLLQKIENHTIIPFKNLFNEGVLKNKEKLNAILITILTDEKFLNYLVTREIGVSLFLKCYKKSIKSINSDNDYWSEELANVQFVREFFRISLHKFKI